MQRRGLRPREDPPADVRLSLAVTCRGGTVGDELFYRLARIGVAIVDWRFDTPVDKSVDGFASGADVGI